MIDAIDAARHLLQFEHARRPIRLTIAAHKSAIAATVKHQTQKRALLHRNTLKVR
jgi:hypothetical protein